MLRGLRRRLSFANVVSVVALFVALSAGAYAAFSLPRNSVKSKNIVNGQVKKADLAPNSIDGTRVKDGSLGGNDVNEATLGQVPSALNATNATNAGNADTLDTLNSTDYGSVMTARVNGLSDPGGTPTTQYGPINSIATATNTQGTLATLSPNHSVVARDLSVKLSAAPGMGVQINTTLAVDGSVSGGFNCVVQDFATTCTSTGTFLIPAGSTIELAFVEVPPMTPIPSFNALVGLRLTPN